MFIMPRHICTATCQRPCPGIVEAKTKDGAREFTEGEEEGGGADDERDGYCKY